MYWANGHRHNQLLRKWSQTREQEISCLWLSMWHCMHWRVAAGEWPTWWLRWVLRPEILPFIRKKNVHNSVENVIPYISHKMFEQVSLLQEWEVCGVVVDVRTVWDLLVPAAYFWIVSSCICFCLSFSSCWPSLTSLIHCFNPAAPQLGCKMWKRVLQYEPCDFFSSEIFSFHLRQSARYM